VDSCEPLLLVVPATLPDAQAATQQVVNLCGRLGIEERALYGTAVMEWLVNVVRHSYSYASDAHISIYVAAGAEGIELRIEDTGAGMAPGEFEAAPAEVIFDDTDIAALPENGMGLAIIKSVMDSVHYHSERGVNRLTAVRRWTR
jgi:serine/threonine-protein kinase RsbW